MFQSGVSKDTGHAIHLPAFGVPIRVRGRATPSHPSIITDVAVEYSNEGPTHKSDLKCIEVKDKDWCSQMFLKRKRKNEKDSRKSMMVETYNSNL